ncbi:site-specific DNA-methyltransferase [Cupriavidus basilensis]|uniref:site-specific DNA-methyltransferase n=1 Tax=Cupriavidus basilensis TaxID=68895 RepID=UPI000750E58E|nr:site-specific DNA-methyltransferase [Cupriavidus basilensis]
MTAQLDLFAHVAAAFADAADRPVSNAELYGTVAKAADIEPAETLRRQPIGASGALHSPFKRAVRWHQQTLKRLGIIERIPDQRGLWRLSEPAGKELDRATSGVKLLAFSTDLGVAIWSKSQDVFPSLGEPIALCFTSIPYPLRHARAYGNPPAAEFVDFICGVIEPIAAGLVPGGSIVLNVSNDIFEDRSPARSLYVERLVLALHDRFGLALMDRIPWVNYSKPPAPTWWACVNRVQLATGYEPILWFTNDPHRIRSDNRRILQEHTARHRSLVRAGGESRTAIYGDGAYRIRPGSFRAETAGRLARNVLERGHACADTRHYRQQAKALGLPVHGAMQPTAIPDFFIRFLTEPGDLVVDPFGGTIRTGLAAERLGRRWLVTEWIHQYIRGAAELFRTAPGFELNPTLTAALSSTGSHR